MVAADSLTPFVIVTGYPTCTDLITQPELRRILTNQQWGLVGVSVTSWYPTGALMSDNQGWNAYLSADRWLWNSSTCGGGQIRQSSTDHDRQDRDDRLFQHVCYKESIKGCFCLPENKCRRLFDNLWYIRPWINTRNVHVLSLTVTL